MVARKLNMIGNLRKYKEREVETRKKTTRKEDTTEKMAWDLKADTKERARER